MKIQFALKTFFICSALVLITACSQDSALQTCDNDRDCPTSQYCAKSGGVFFSTDHCVDRAAEQPFDAGQDVDLRDVATTSDVADVENTGDVADVENTNDVDDVDDVDVGPSIACESICPGDFPICDENRDQCVVFVSKAGDDAGNSGLKPDAPVATLTEALQVAVRHNRPYLLVTGGDFVEQLTLKNGISIYGGYDPDHNWERNPDIYETNISRGSIKSGQEGENFITVIADTITKPTVLNGLIIRGANTPVPSASTIGLWARKSNNLILQNVNVVAGSAGNGKNGADGVNATADACTPLQGGSGGHSDTSISPCSPDPSRNQSGMSGEAEPHEALPRGGSGGEGSFGICSDVKINETADNGEPGKNGKPGSKLITTKTAEPNFNASGEWIIFSGSEPQNGMRGSGGGGGGAGGHYELKKSNKHENILIAGGSGGRGGAGGCGGLGARNGMSGGSSFGMVIFGELIIFNKPITVVLGRGGNGGNGGTGGAGFNGQLGSSGLPGECIDQICAGQGGTGGRGGAGGPGKHGFSGYGGNAFGIVLDIKLPLDMKESDMEGNGIQDIVFEIDHAKAGLPGTSPALNRPSEGVISEGHLSYFVDDGPQ